MGRIGIRTGGNHAYFRFSLAPGSVRVFTGSHRQTLLEGFLPAVPRSSDKYESTHATGSLYFVIFGRIVVRKLNYFFFKLTFSSSRAHLRHRWGHTSLGGSSWHMGVLEGPEGGRAGPRGPQGGQAQTPGGPGGPPGPPKLAGMASGSGHLVWPC